MIRKFLDKTTKKQLIRTSSSYDLPTYVNSMMYIDSSWNGKDNLDLKMITTINNSTEITQLTASTPKIISTIKPSDVQQKKPTSNNELVSPLIRSEHNLSDDTLYDNRLTEKTININESDSLKRRKNRRKKEKSLNNSKQSISNPFKRSSSNDNRFSHQKHRDHQKTINHRKSSCFLSEDSLIHFPDNILEETKLESSGSNQNFSLKTAFFFQPNFWRNSNQLTGKRTKSKRSEKLLPDDQDHHSIKNLEDNSADFLYDNNENNSIDNSIETTTNSLSSSSKRLLTGTTAAFLTSLRRLDDQWKNKDNNRQRSHPHQRLSSATAITDLTSISSTVKAKSFSPISHKIDAIHNLPTTPTSNVIGKSNQLSTISKRSIQKKFGNNRNNKEQLRKGYTKKDLSEIYSKLSSVNIIATTGSDSSFIEGYAPVIHEKKYCLNQTDNNVETKITRFSNMTCRNYYNDYHETEPYLAANNKTISTIDGRMMNSIYENHYSSLANASTITTTAINGSIMNNNQRINRKNLYATSNHKNYRYGNEKNHSDIRQQHEVYNESSDVLDELDGMSKEEMELRQFAHDQVRSIDKNQKEIELKEKKLREIIMSRTLTHNEQQKEETEMELSNLKNILQNKETELKYAVDYIKQLKDDVERLRRSQKQQANQMESSSAYDNYYLNVNDYEVNGKRQTKEMNGNNWKNSKNNYENGDQPNGIFDDGIDENNKTLPTFINDEFVNEIGNGYLSLKSASKNQRIDLNFLLQELQYLDDKRFGNNSERISIKQQNRLNVLMNEIDALKDQQNIQNCLKKNTQGHLQFQSQQQTQKRPVRNIPIDSNMSIGHSSKRSHFSPTLNVINSPTSSINSSSNSSNRQNHSIDNEPNLLINTSKLNGNHLNSSSSLQQQLKQQNLTNKSRTINNHMMNKNNLNGREDQGPRQKSLPNGNNKSTVKRMAIQDILHNGVNYRSLNRYFHSDINDDVQRLSGHERNLRDQHSNQSPTNNRFPSRQMDQTDNLYCPNANVIRRNNMNNLNNEMKSNNINHHQLTNMPNGNCDERVVNEKELRSISSDPNDKRNFVKKLQRNKIFIDNQYNDDIDNVIHRDHNSSRTSSTSSHQSNSLTGNRFGRSTKTNNSTSNQLQAQKNNINHRFASKAVIANTYMTKLGPMTFNKNSQSNQQQQQQHNSSLPPNQYLSNRQQMPQQQQQQQQQQQKFNYKSSSHNEMSRYVNRSEANHQQPNHSHQYHEEEKHIDNQHDTGRLSFRHYNPKAIKKRHSISENNHGTNLLGVGGGIATNMKEFDKNKYRISSSNTISNEKYPQTEKEHGERVKSTSSNITAFYVASTNLPWTNSSDSNVWNQHNNKLSPSMNVDKHRTPSTIHRFSDRNLEHHTTNMDKRKKFFNNDDLLQQAEQINNLGKISNNSPNHQKQHYSTMKNDRIINNNNNNNRKPSPMTSPRREGNNQIEVNTDNFCGRLDNVKSVGTSPIPLIILNRYKCGSQQSDKLDNRNNQTELMSRENNVFISSIDNQNNDAQLSSRVSSPLSATANSMSLGISTTSTMKDNESKSNNYLNIVGNQSSKLFPSPASTTSSVLSSPMLINKSSSSPKKEKEKKGRVDLVNNSCLDSCVNTSTDHQLEEAVKSSIRYTSSFYSAGDTHNIIYSHINPYCAVVTNSNVSDIRSTTPATTSFSLTTVGGSSSTSTSTSTMATTLHPSSQYQNSTTNLFDDKKFLQDPSQFPSRFNSKSINSSLSPKSSSSTASSVTSFLSDQTKVNEGTTSTNPTNSIGGTSSPKTNCEEKNNTSYNNNKINNATYHISLETTTTTTSTTTQMKSNNKKTSPKTSRMDSAPILKVQTHTTLKSTSARNICGSIIKDLDALDLSEINGSISNNNDDRPNDMANILQTMSTDVMMFDEQPTTINKSDLAKDGNTLGKIPPITKIDDGKRTLNGSTKVLEGKSDELLKEIPKPSSSTTEEQTDGKIDNVPFPPPSSILRKRSKYATQKEVEEEEANKSSENYSTTNTIGTNSTNTLTSKSKKLKASLFLLRSNKGIEDVTMSNRKIASEDDDLINRNNIPHYDDYRIQKKNATIDPHALLLDGAVEGELTTVVDNCIIIGSVEASKPNDEGITALHNAVCAGHDNIIRWLIFEAGVDVNVCDVDGWTPLHCAASCNATDLAGMLIESGACLWSRTSIDDEMPIHKCELKEMEYDKCYKYLREMQTRIGRMNNRKVYAIFDHQSNENDELNVHINDELTVLSYGDEEHLETLESDETLLLNDAKWWKVKITNSYEDSRNGQIGLVPLNILALYPRIMPQTLSDNHRKAFFINTNGRDLRPHLSSTNIDDISMNKKENWLSSPSENDENTSNAPYIPSGDRLINTTTTTPTTITNNTSLKKTGNVDISMKMENNNSTSNESIRFDRSPYSQECNA
ncbi:hypothetical protein SNEBB_007265 [Seison nebaliae]|nr:hypothetical protein SNEBB_007265 [Seison nebaliae]